MTPFAMSEGSLPSRHPADLVYPRGEVRHEIAIARKEMSTVHILNGTVLGSDGCISTEVPFGAARTLLDPHDYVGAGNGRAAIVSQTTRLGKAFQRSLVVSTPVIAKFLPWQRPQLKTTAEGQAEI